MYSLITHIPDLITKFHSQKKDKLKKVSLFGAGLLVGTALTVIIPEGIRALYDDRPITPPIKLGTESSIISTSPDHHTHSNEHSQAIGLSLVLGFIFMMLIDHISTKQNDSAGQDKNLTATIGLVVHAAGLFNQILFLN